MGLYKSPVLIYLTRKVVIVLFSSNRFLKVLDLIVSVIAIVWFALIVLFQLKCKLENTVKWTMKPL